MCTGSVGRAAVSSSRGKGGLSFSQVQVNCEPLGVDSRSARNAPVSATSELSTVLAAY